MTWKLFSEKAFDKAWDFVSDFVAGGLGSHFFQNRVDDQNRVVLMPDGKTPARELDMKKIRSAAPHFAKKLEDEAEFQGLVGQLQAGQQKSLEIWMASLGRHQRADLILTIVEMTVLKDLDRAEGRELAVKRLGQIADISPDVFKTRAAMGFNLIKASENDYLGAQLTEQASRAIVYLINQVTLAQTEWDAWVIARTGEIDNDTNRMHTARQARNAVRTQTGIRGVWNRFQQSHRRLGALPWE